MAPPSAIGVEVEGVRDTEGIVLPDPLTVNGISARRAKAGRLIAGTAAYTNSDFFKSSGVGKPKAKRWDRKSYCPEYVAETNLCRIDYISTESKSRTPSSLKGAAKFLKQPGLISLGGGLPCAEYFPIEELNFKVPKPPQFSEEECAQTGQFLKAGKYDISDGHGTYDLAVALNYGQGSGSAQLLRFVTEHTEIVCNPPYEDWHCALSVGSTSALEQTYRMLCERGDYVLSEEYTFASAVETAAPLGIK